MKDYAIIANREGKQGGWTFHPTFRVTASNVDDAIAIAISIMQLKKGTIWCRSYSEEKEVKVKKGKIV